MFPMGSSAFHEWAVQPDENLPRPTRRRHLSPANRGTQPVPPQTHPLVADVDAAPIGASFTFCPESGRRATYRACHVGLTGPARLPASAPAGSPYTMPRPSVPRYTRPYRLGSPAITRQRTPH